MRQLSQRNWKAVPLIADTNFLSIHRANGDPLGLQVCVHIDVRCLGVIPLAVGKLDSISIRSLRYLDLSAASKPTHHHAFVDTFVGFRFDKFMGVGRDLFNDVIAPCQCESECERDDCSLHLFLPRRFYRMVFRSYARRLTQNLGKRKKQNAYSLISNRKPWFTSGPSS